MKYIKRLIALIVLATLLPFSTGAQERERPEEERIEPEAIVILRGGQDYVCYTVDNSKKLAHLIEDYHLLWLYALKSERKIISLEKDNFKLNELSIEWKGMAETQKERGDQYLEAWKVVNYNFSAFKKNEKILDWIPWGLSGLQAVAIIILSISSSLNK